MHKYLAVLCFLLVSYITAGDVTADEQDSYTFGVVPQFDALTVYSIWRPLLDELERLTKLNFSLSGSATIPSFEQEFMCGKFDFAYMNPYHVILSQNDIGYIPLVRDTGRDLTGIVVVRTDSAISSIRDLNQRTVAFPSPYALGATLLVRSELRDDYQVELVPQFVQSHSSVYLNVALGETDAGGGVQQTFEQQPEDIRGLLRILYRTRAVASHPIVASPRVPAADREKVRNALLRLGKSEKGRALLAKIPVEKIGSASMADYASVTNMLTAQLSSCR
jgi:phosphonate transport system substrate-binding protein